MRYRRLVGSLKGLRQVLTEVHGEVGQVFHDDGVIFCGQFANGFQFLLCQANPCRVVGIRVDDGTYIALSQIALQLVAELVAAVVVHVEGLVFHSLHLQLHLLHREPWVDKQHRVLRLVCL